MSRVGAEVDSDPKNDSNIIEELLAMIQTYEIMCERILKKGALSVRDEYEYQAAIDTIAKCEKELEELGYFEGF